MSNEQQQTSTKPKTPRIWHPQHEKVLKTWGESAACYRYLHYKAYQGYKLMNMRFTLPVIIISTVTGTANFAQNTFPSGWQPYVPSVIGALNLVAAIMTTVQQFLKTSELMESHRVSSLNYGKFTRNIRLEITMPVNDRTHHGANFVDICASEYDRLLQQCPPIPGPVMKVFDSEFPEKKNPDHYANFARPEIMSIKPINLYEDGIFESILERVKNMFKPESKDTAKKIEAKESLIRELEELRSKTLVSNPEVSIPIIPSHPANSGLLH